MIPIIQAVIPTTQHVTNTPSNKVSHKWAATQLNLIMLPVGVGILIIVSCIACICGYLRKRRIKQLRKELIRQRRQASKKCPNTFSNGHCSFSSKQSTAIMSTVTSPERTSSMSPTSQKSQFSGREKCNGGSKDRKELKGSATYLNGKSYHKKHTKNQQMPKEKQIDGAAHHPAKKRRTSVGPVEESNGLRPGTSIPVPLQQVQKKRTTRYASERNASPVRSSSPVKSNKEISRNNNDNNDPMDKSLDSDETNLSRDRRKWEIPDINNLGYDKKGSLRLPPLAELRLSKTA